MCLSAGLGRAIYAFQSKRRLPLDLVLVALLSSKSCKILTILQDYLRYAALDQSLYPSDMHWGCHWKLVDHLMWSRVPLRPSIAWKDMSELSRLRTITGGVALALFAYSFLPILDCSVLSLPSCRRWSRCVVVVGIRRCAYVLRLQEVKVNLSLISRALPFS